MSTFDSDFTLSFGLSGTDNPKNRRNESVLRLKKAWMNERNSPTILDYDSAAVTEVQDLISQKQSDLDETEDTRGVEEKFASSLAYMDLDRVKYVLSSYLRARLRKLHSFPLYVLLDESISNRLSSAEMEYVQGLVNLMDAHYQKSFLESIPECFRKIDDPEERMIQQPKLDSHVFCRVNVGGTYQVGEDVLTSGQEFEEGDIYILRFRHIEALINSNRLELI